MDNINIFDILENIIELDPEEYFKIEDVKKHIADEISKQRDKEKIDLWKTIGKKLQTELIDKFNLENGILYTINELSLKEKVIRNDLLDIKNHDISHYYDNKYPAGEANPLYKKNRTVYMHFNTKHIEPNAENLYDNNAIASSDNYLVNKINQIITNSIEIVSIKIEDDGGDCKFTLYLNASIPSNTVISSLSFTENQDVEIKGGNIFSLFTSSTITSSITLASPKTIEFTTNIPYSSSLVKTMSRAITREHFRKDFFYDYINDYGNHYNTNPSLLPSFLDKFGTPILDDEYNAWVTGGSLDTHPFHPSNRTRYPPVILYGTRKVPRPENNNFSYTEYGEFTESSYNVTINDGNSLYQPIKTYEKYFKEDNNNFTINLGRTLTNVTKIGLEDFSFVNSNFTFMESKKNNYFEIDCSGTILPISIPDGTYSGEQVATLIDSIVDKSYLGVSYSKNTGKIFFYSSPDAAIDISFNLMFGNSGVSGENVSDTTKVNDDITKNAGWLLGFKKNYVRSSVLSDSNKTKQLKLEVITSKNGSDTIVEFSCIPDVSLNYTAGAPYNHLCEAESVYKKHINKNYFFAIDDFNHNYYDNHFCIKYNHQLKNNILAKINCKVDDNFNHDVLTSKDFEYRFREYFGPVSIDRLNVRLYDDDGELLHINNNDYSFTLRFDILYTKI
jgi:hypothetical protein